MASRVDLTDPVEELDLPIRAYHALVRNGVRTVDSLCELTEDEFLRMRNVGEGSLRDVKAILARHGLALRSTPIPPPDPAEVSEAEWIGHQIRALAEDDHVWARTALGTRWKGEGAELHNRRRAWAWYRWGIDPDAEWPRDKAGGFGYMATPLPGSYELHLAGLNRLAHEELDGE
jgi:hypothetical protein